MAAVLIRMKLAVIRHGLRGTRLAQMGWDILFGLTAAALTIAVSLGEYASRQVESDMLALAFGVWTLGWMLGPIVFVGEDKTLLPEHFRFLPVTPRELASGLLAAAFAGIPAVISLLAFLALFLYALPLGALPAIIAVPALVLQLVFVVLLSRAAAGAFRAFAKSALTAALSSLVTGGIMAFFVSGWVLLELDLERLFAGLPEVFSAALYILPSGWGLAAVNAAHEGRWGFAAMALAGLCLLIALLRACWGLLLARRLTVKTAKKPAFRRAAGRSYAVFASPGGGGRA
ncbi:ABC-2 type transport system permease protein [Paenibacillus sp. UNC496MF]|uniref:hypothetical protein n=1 Tax=Paenibacillus sp. UNC496MF TaxID=1502753 RepID=UPI0008EA8102|nr:hypothetical protein [Paenibacillus sp. UNC496MF]SFJ76779.1 ABC-2 type transport system permease protein [Paenibacillus sp. UNC496MF]